MGVMLSIDSGRRLCLMHERQGNQSVCDSSSIDSPSATNSDMM